MKRRKMDKGLKEILEDVYSAGYLANKTNNRKGVPVYKHIDQAIKQILALVPYERTENMGFALKRDIISKKGVSDILLIYTHGWNDFRDEIFKNFGGKKQ